ncbi:MAG: matrixin family metalloprotease [Candidatus Gastranaerophilaceae bacterium]
MTISNNINKYIKDSLINNKICRFNKQTLTVFVSKIVAKMFESDKFSYYNEISKAIQIWNNYAPVKFVQIESAQNADIIINWTKVGIKNEGMCKYRSIINCEIKAITIDIGLPNSYSPKTITNSTILHTILHELGHAMGLGHGVEANDIMFVPHQKTLNKPSENDIFVLNLLYKNNIGTSVENINIINF